MKYLKKFTKHNNYSAFIVGSVFKNLEKDNVSFCKSEQHVHYNVYVPPIPKFLDILYSDADGNLKFTDEVLPVSEGKTPIALCIAAQGFFGENEKARWMSLKYMNYTTPDTGSLTLQNMKWGNGTDITTIDNISYLYDGFYYNWGYYTADWITGTNNKVPPLWDENGNWNLSILGTINMYGATDIDGKNKTIKIIDTATSQENWRTDESIVNISDAGYTPAACCCWRYHTLGTKSGNWYLGACGEMSIIVVQKPAINNKLAAISALYPNDCISTIYNNDYWTSTEYSNKNVFTNGFTGGTFGLSSKTDNRSTFAMLQY